MASKRYTAKEMRERAEIIENAFLDMPTAEMLRQAADMMEREEKREKNYEYGIRYCVDDGSVFEDERHFDSLKDAKDNADVSGYDELKFDRREVGEWEEVEDGECRT